MAHNVEIKARAVDFAGQGEVARFLSGAEPEVIHQEDIYFYVSTGRLKLRVFSPDSGELIFYQRPDQVGPKISQYEISKTQDPSGLKSILEKAFGIRNTVIKTRHLYQQGRTRIHLDRVEALGEFIELEVVLSDDDELADGENEAQELMLKLGIEAEHLIELAYVDMLEPKPLP
jgi:predicted adenylyl cyclase CyaB